MCAHKISCVSIKKLKIFPQITKFFNIFGRIQKFFAKKQTVLTEKGENFTEKISKTPKNGYFFKKLSKTHFFQIFHQKISEVAPVCAKPSVEKVAEPEVGLTENSTLSEVTESDGNENDQGKLFSNF